VQLYVISQLFLITDLRADGSMPIYIEYASLTNREEQLSEFTTEVKSHPQRKPPRSWSYAAKGFLMATLAAVGLFLEIRGIKFGYLRYLAIVMAAMVAMFGLDGFTNSYNRLLRTPSTVKRLKLSAEKAAAIGVIGLTFAVALGLYNFDSTNSEANGEKLYSVQREMIPKATLLGCKNTPSDPTDCQAFYSALNKLGAAVYGSDARGMAAGVDEVRIRWLVLGSRWPFQTREEYYAAVKGLDELKFWSDAEKQRLALSITVLLLPFAIGATSRKLAIAAFDVKFSEVPVTWRMVTKRALLSMWRTMFSFLKKPSD